ncbi:Spy/CpxP family protein refolding chaperone [Variovorax soli]|uniref:LTXXQ motif family protein n=1 Tax=Variovorax soli TaxID=376815 RepID=A0ABU1N7X3_9BURK|nr:Spy/CpxP family protein refolding chaperone [Variovorax soli]MDR6534542.1 hypothetical protein [Variovorax soli]
MISSRQKKLMAGLVASAAFACSTGFAQGNPPSTTGPAAAAAAQAAPADAKPSRPHADRAQRIERMQARHAERMAALKQKLQLDPSQEGAWNSFTAAQQRPAGQARMDRAEFAKLTTPQRLEHIQARQAERSARFAQRAEATRSFYATLSPAQQKTFDAETAHFGHRGEHGHPHHGQREPAKS